MHLSDAKDSKKAIQLSESYYQLQRPYCMYASNECSDETVRAHKLV